MWRARFLGESAGQLPPATKLRQGNVFTPVCHSVYEGCLPQCMLGYTLSPADTTTGPPPQADTPLVRHSPPPPRSDMLGYGQQVGGTHTFLFFFHFTLRFPVQTLLSVAPARSVFWRATQFQENEHTRPSTWGNYIISNNQKTGVNIVLLVNRF